MKGIIIIYVDDFLLIGEEQTIKQVVATVQAEWKTSDLTFLRPGHPLRFLGMELELSRARMGRRSTSISGDISRRFCGLTILARRRRTKFP